MDEGPADEGPGDEPVRDGDRPGRGARSPRGSAHRLAVGALLVACVGVLGSVDAARTVDASFATARPAAAGPAAGGPAVTPRLPSGLPAGLEDLAPYVKQASCNPVDQPGTVQLGRLLVDTYPGTSYSISRACGADGFASEHYEGRAVDWFVSVRDPAQAARAQALLGWLFAADAAGHRFANARRLGVMYVIWDDQIWGSYATDAGWRPYNGCSTRPDPAWDTTCHRDHVHLSLSWAGARGRTSFWTAQVAPVDYGPCRPPDLNWAPAHRFARLEPCPAYPTLSAPAGAVPALAAEIRFGGAELGPGSTGPAVRAVQQGLGLTTDAGYGPLTQAAVAAFQSARLLPPTGRMDADTWRALIAATGGVPPSPATPPSPAPPAPPAPSAAPSAPPAPSPPPAPPPVTLPTRQPDPAPGTGLRYGARGPAVQALQRAVGVSPVSGWFGPRTWTAVAAVQRAHGLPVTGVVDLATWRLLASARP